MGKITDQLIWINLKNTNGEARVFSPRDKTSVARIPAGWLLRFNHFHGSSSSLTTQAMIFVPDPSHAWQPETENIAWQRVSKQVNANYGDYTDMLRVWNGWIYKNSFFNGNQVMHLSLVFVPEVLVNEETSEMAGTELHKCTTK